MAGLRQYQIRAIVETTCLAIEKKLGEIRDQLRAKFEPSREEKKILDDLDILKELCLKEEEYRNKILKLRNEINEYSDEKFNKNVLSTYGTPSSYCVEEAKKQLIENSIKKELPDIPGYCDIERNLTVATVMIGFNIEEWIDNYVKKVCGE